MKPHERVGVYIHTLLIRTKPDTKGEGTRKKLATAKQPQRPRNVTEFKQATVFQFSRRKLRKLMFD
jgi:hypothetical protein